MLRARTPSALTEAKTVVATCHQMIVCCTDDIAAILKMDMDKAYEYLKILPSLVKLSRMQTHVHRHMRVYKMKQT